MQVSREENESSDAPGLIGNLPPSAAIQTACLCILFGANAVAVKLSLAGLGIFTTAGIRFGVASLVIFTYARLLTKPLAVNRKQLRQLVPLGGIFFVQLSLFYLGLSKTTASHGTLIANVLPFVVMLLAHFFIPGDRITLKKFLGLILGFSGVVVLLAGSLTASSDVLYGDMAVLMAIMVWGCNAVYAKRIIWNFHPIQITLYPMLMASMGFILCGIFVDQQSIFYIDGWILGALFYQTFVTASFGMVVWSSMIKKYGATNLHAFIFIMPISGVFFGVMLLGEPLTANLLGAILLVTAGLVVVNR
ncbi:MAG: DMT family transporter [Desulfopila sp.]